MEAKTDGHWTPLRTLIQHSTLANYNRELINWKLDDETYRNYVLWPDVYHEVPDSSAQIPKSAIGNRPAMRDNASHGAGKLFAAGLGNPSAIRNDSALSTNAAPSTINYQLSTSPWHRRPLWEYFYPPIRHETDPQFAAQIVLKFLHERITVASGAGILPVQSLDIDRIWRERKADPGAFEALTVAALRSVGIPARLNSTGHAEIFANGQWQSQLTTDH